MNRERIEETFRLWKARPDKAKGKPMVTARAGGSKAVMVTSPWARFPQLASRLMADAFL